MNNKRLGKLQKDCLRFYYSKEVNHSWIGYHDDYVTKKRIESLVRRGLLEINKFNQARSILREPLKKDFKCICEETDGYFQCGIKGVLAHVENGKIIGEVERCDLCCTFASDEKAKEFLIHFLN